MATALLNAAENTEEFSRSSSHFSRREERQSVPEGIKFMAKSCHLKEIADYEMGCSWLKPSGTRENKEIKTKGWPFSSGRKFVDEMTIWKTALQLETMMSNQGGQAR